MTKPFTWEEIEELLRKELKKTKHILTFGTIGSLNIEHDIDIIITKKSDSKSSDFYKEVHKIYNNLNTYLNKKYSVKAIRFYNLADENFLKSFGVCDEKDLELHTTIYQSLPQIEIDWAGAQSGNIKRTLKKDYKCLIGNPKDLFSDEFIKKRHLDKAYNLIFHSDRSCSQMPEKALVKFMNGMFNYIYRRILEIEPKTAKNKKEVRDIFYTLCDKIDELNKQK